jgi:alpha-tubulin suppressor-like RCC1 family protein
VQTVEATGVVEAGAGAHHSCILDNTHAVKCAGSDVYGQLGNGGGTDPSNSTFSIVPNLAEASTISVGGYHSCAMLLSNAFIKCWGWGDIGILGNGETGNAYVPVVATLLNTGSANIQLEASFSNTYVDI